MKAKITIDIEKCKGCGLCIEFCRPSVISMSKPSQVNSSGLRYIVAENSKCIGCMLCAQVCPDSVIEVYKEK